MGALQPVVTEAKVCSCGTALGFIETLKGRQAPVEVPAIKAYVYNFTAGTWVASDVYAAHHPRCPDVQRYRK